MQISVLRPSSSQITSREIFHLRARLLDEDTAQPRGVRWETIQVAGSHHKDPGDESSFGAMRILNDVLITVATQLTVQGPNVYPDCLSPLRLALDS